MMTHEKIIVGIDLGENWLHIVGIAAQGKPILRKQLNRNQLVQCAATAPQCILTMELCLGSQHWGRRFSAHGHEIRIIPAQFGKPYLRSNKNDINIYLRKLSIQGAYTLLINMKRNRSRLGQWLQGIGARRHRNVAVVALAN